MEVGEFKLFRRATKVGDFKVDEDEILSRTLKGQLRTRIKARKKNNFWKQ